MKLSQLLALPASIATAVLAAGNPEYAEHLQLRPLPNGYLYAGFNFTASTSLSAYQAQHFRYFPRSLGQILQFSGTEELHLRFALGRWDEETWGSRPRNGRREGGTGVEIWAWLDARGGADAVSERWSTLVNSLSGLFCASLNFIDGTKTTQPVLSFQPEGQHMRRNGSLQLLHGTLPHEVICTENLTPFLKLLPCKGKAGISSLLDGHKVFDANWQTMSIDVRPVCNLGAGDCRLEIEQTVDIVMDIERSMRPRDDPIPRPPPIEEVECDETKFFNAHDTCYPKRAEGEMRWSLSKIFGTPVIGSCHLANSEQAYDISLDVSPSREVNVTSGTEVHSANGNRRLYVLPNDGSFDLELPHQVDSVQLGFEQPPLLASRQMTGYGQERGGMHTVLYNPHAYPQRIVYLDSLPWFLRPYMHTLQVDGTKVEKMYYTPAIDRQRGTHLELLMTVPAQSTVELKYDFEKAILRYTEYPPDANRGFDVAPAVIRILSYEDNINQQGSYLRTTSLLLPLPTPDFSMPYNVIILTSTVIALGFGSIFNFLIRRFVLPEEVPSSPLAGFLSKIRNRVGLRVKTKDTMDARQTSGSTTLKEKTIVNGANGVRARSGHGVKADE